LILTSWDILVRRSKQNPKKIDLDGVLAIIAVAKYHEPPKYCTNRGHDELPTQTMHYFMGKPSK